MAVRGVAVHDQMQAQGLGRSAVDQSQELEPLTVAVPWLAHRDHAAVQGVERCKQRGRSVAFVVMGDGAAPVPADAGPAWLGQRFDEAPAEFVLERLSGLAPREMRRVWTTGFGNARLAGRGAVGVADLPDGAARRSPIGFVQ